MSDVAQKLWGFCHTLRHDGIGYLDYIEQITYLLFIKMADERGIELPEGYDWPSLAGLSGMELTDHYILTLNRLAKEQGLLGKIYFGAQSRFRNPVNLKQLVSMIDKVEWTSLDVDVKGQAFEGLLEKAASEGKKGAGQYFTPRPLIKAIVRCVQPWPLTPGPSPRGGEGSVFTIGDPACGTGGFLVCAYEWLMGITGGALERGDAARIRKETYHGQEIDPLARRLAVMNLYLHGVEPDIAYGDSIYEVYAGPRFDVVMTNPPFGTKGANQVPDRDEFTISTSNKQLNFLQHVMHILKPGGRAAVVLPDNCLFADKAGEVFEILTQDCDLHTVWRLPRGTFSPYSEGTKTNVVFFRKGPATESVWIYDGRTNVPKYTKKERPLLDSSFSEFERCFGVDAFGRAGRNPEERWRGFSINEVRERAFKLDGFKWLKEDSLDDSDDLPEPEELATDAIGELELAVEELNRILALLENGAEPRELVGAA